MRVNDRQSQSYSIIASETQKQMGQTGSGKVGCLLTWSWLGREPAHLVRVGEGAWSSLAIVEVVRITVIRSCELPAAKRRSARLLDNNEECAATQPTTKLNS